MFSLRYGPESQLRLELPASIEIFDHSSPQGLEISDPAAAVIQALAAPLDYPPLPAATVPGDRVVVAVDCTVPKAGQVVEGCLRTLMGAKTRPEDIRVLTNGDANFAESLLQWAPGDVRYAVKVTQHDPDDKQSHAYLAATEEGNPIHVNRLLVDADVVLPVGVLRLDSSLAYYGSAGTIFPTFADRETQKRYERSETDILLGATPPSKAHWFGTDRNGRDYMTQIAYAGQLSLKIGVAVAFIATFIGSLVAVILITFLAPSIATFALKFGPPEFFAVYLLTFCSFVGLGKEATITRETYRRAAAAAAKHARAAKLCLRA